MESGDRSKPSMAGVGRAGFIRDPSGLLMSIIRTLASSDDDHQRDQEKERLEEAFASNDEKLDELVEVNYEELARTIKLFGKIGERISESRSRIKRVKENLLQCKSLLHCRQDDLRKLWIEGVEHKKILWLLDEIEEVKAAPENIEQFMKQKNYLHATKLILRVLGMLEDDLIKVEALNDIRNELVSRRIRMHEGFIDELHRQMYFNSIKLLNAGNDTKDNLAFYADEENLNDLSKDLDKEPLRLMAVLVFSLGKLGRMPDALEAIKARMDRHINMIVTHTTVEITDLHYKQDKEKEEPKRLLQLLELLFNKFRCIVKAHDLVLGLFKHIIFNSKVSIEVQLYTIDEVWSKIQSVLQSLLYEYLDVDNSAANSQQIQVGFSDVHSGSFASHFSRKRTTRPNTVKLFKFEASSHAISMNTYLREQRAEQRITSGNSDTVNPELVDHNITTQKVCKPNSRNLTMIFGPLNAFIQEIENALNYGRDRKCSLNEFITDYIQNVFIRQVQYDMKKNFDTASKVTEPLKALTDVNSNPLINAQCQYLLQSTVVVDQCVWDLHSLMINLGEYQDQFLAMICSILHEYKETLIQSYRGIVQPESEDQRIVSATWVRESDIYRELRSFENWRIVHQSEKSSPLGKHSARILRDFYREGLYTVAKLGDEMIGQNGLVQDVTDMAAIGNLHESLEWFVKRLRLLISKINVSASEDTMQMLNQLCQDYNNMCDVALLCLHVEARVHCFYHLMPMFKTNSYDIRSLDNTERDPMVIKLSKDINSIYESLRNTLQPHKQSYVFEGLGHQISGILINGSKFINRITHSGIKKMCRNIFVLQQTLTHVTLSREAHLDGARLYFEMLYHSPDDLQTIVVEQGVQFEEEDYVNAVELLHRSRPGSGGEGTRMARIQRLRSIVQEHVHKNKSTDPTDNE